MNYFQYYELTNNGISALMIDAENRPYEPPKSIIDRHDPRILCGMILLRQFPILTGFVLLVSILISCIKWLMPPIIGTGGAYSLGTWIEEWVLVVVSSIVLRVIAGRSAWWFPLIFLVVAYIGHIPVYISSKFSLIVFVHGVFVTFLSVLTIGFMEIAISICSRTHPEYPESGQRDNE